MWVVGGENLEDQCAKVEFVEWASSVSCVERTGWHEAGVCMRV